MTSPSAPDGPLPLSGRWLVVQTRADCEGDIRILGADGPFHCRPDAEASASRAEDTSPPSTSWTVLHRPRPDDATADEDGGPPRRAFAGPPAGPMSGWPPGEPDPVALRDLLRKVASGQDGGRDAAMLVVLIDRAVRGSSVPGSLDGLLAGTDAALGRRSGLGRQRTVRALASLVRQGMVVAHGRDGYSLSPGLTHGLTTADR